MGAGSSAFSMAFLFVFALCRQSPADMPLSLVGVQNNFDIRIQAGIEFFQPVGHILMYGRFGNVELLCGRAYRGFVFYYIIGKCDGSFFRKSLQRKSPQQRIGFVLLLCGGISYYV